MFSHFHAIFDALTRLERRVWFTAATVFLASATLMSVHAFYEGTTLAPVAGGRYREAMVGQPAYPNPLIAQSEVDRSMATLLYSGLLDLTERTASSDDHLTWTLTLKRGGRWTDGEPITARDVLFTVEAIQDPDARSPLAATWQGVAAERVSEYEIRFTLRAPYAFFLENLRDLRVVSQHIFGTIPLANLRLSDYHLEPVGSGPYAFARLTKRRDGFITSYALERNESYAGSQTLISAFTLHFYPTAAEATSAFNRREVDGLGGLDPAALPELTAAHTLRQIEAPRYYALFLNQSAAPALKERAVREALSRAVDRDRLIREVFEGYATPILGPLHPRIRGYDASAYGKGNTFDLEASRALLDGAGWKPNAEGVRAKAGKKGEEPLALAFEVVVPDIPFLREAARVIREDWASIGARLTPVVMDPNSVAAEAIRTRSYQVILFGNILKPHADVFSFWHSSERFAPGLNLSLYDSRAADALLETIRRDFDEVSREKSAHELQARIAEDIPALFLFSPQYLYAHARDLGGFEAEFLPTPAHRFESVAKWYLKTARVFK